MAAEASNTITLTSADGTPITVSRKAGMMCQIVKDLMEDLPESETSLPIPVSQVETATLKKIVAWLQEHENDVPKKKEDSKEMEIRSVEESRLEPRDQTFFKTLNQEELFALICAANFLDVSGLLNGLTVFVAEQIRGMSTQEMRDYFGIESDFTPEEEAQIRAEHEWANNPKNN
ncbi:E3 ubiquitin ligase complex SCF subunit sconC [Hypomontagnella monticulosa]|nr:E3 ubiquitin ligase complex SCF subunit sconC [Hypomontagnella monticulosa]